MTRPQLEGKVAEIYREGFQADMKEIEQNKRTKACILCGRCLEVCPLFRATDCEELSPRAKHQLSAGLNQGVLQAPSAKDLAALCLGCGRCESACPQGLCVPEVVSELRNAHPGMQEWLWNIWMGAGKAFWPALSRLGAIAPSWMPGEARAKSLEAMRSGNDIVPWIFLEGPPSVDSSGEAFVIFPGCLASTVRPEWTSTAAALLGAVGKNVQQTPDWACCGSTLGHAGLLERQREAREQNLLAWREAGAPRIVVFCATCRCGLMSYASDMTLPWLPGEQLAWQRAITPLAEQLSGARFHIEENVAPERVHYHRPCHGGGQGGGHGGGGPDLALLREMVGDLLHAPDKGQCCGMGGIFQLGAPSLSRTVADRCWGVYAPLPGEQLLTACSGCVVQLAATAPAKVAVGHWLDAVRVADAP